MIFLPQYGIAGSGFIFVPGSFWTIRIPYLGATHPELNYPRIKCKQQQQRNWENKCSWYTAIAYRFEFGFLLDYVVRELGLHQLLCRLLGEHLPLPHGDLPAQRVHGWYLSSRELTGFVSTINLFTFFKKFSPVNWARNFLYCSFSISSAAFCWKYFMFKKLRTTGVWYTFK